MGLDSRNPTICLVCGTVLCAQSTCCQVERGGASLGACTAHYINCEHGMFLRVRDSKAFLLSGIGRGGFISPPYVDEYGETDQGLRRGNPLRLSYQKYEFFRRLWINHGIPEEVVRLNDRNTALHSFSYTDWARI